MQTVEPPLLAYHPKEYDSPQCIKGNHTLVKLMLLQWRLPPNLPLVSSPNTCHHQSSPQRYLGSQYMLIILVVASWLGCPENPSNVAAILIQYDPSYCSRGSACIFQLREQ